MERRYDIEGPEVVDKEVLEVIDFEYPGTYSTVEISTQEFTSVCPWSGLPDFGEIFIEYVPNIHLIELKSLKFYLLSFRNVGILQEHAANKILKDLVETCDPLEMKVTGYFSLRGGLKTKVTVKYNKEK
ncbi:preQ(1) synthase [Candidatus Contubernalis alkaliaceticus]|uniref:preQ(1) synthase n=1 Tax=Candidatus Contubernalis alkaliaceticus TaxID=338645 RepID=UPI001F4C3A26|nr:preQ(1) synthase [Candidatus Contubernalis alkalaceticus]UNC91801.1 NADPH-dependent 7-cyano-7-deazaguanine reductase QueF [Candidatus Contubernalis alkalaceticus]